MAAAGNNTCASDIFPPATATATATATWIQAQPLLLTLSARLAKVAGITDASDAGAGVLLDAGGTVETIVLGLTQIHSCIKCTQRRQNVTCCATHD